ncbi:ABC transporter ATP-binding protein [Mesorhizobium sp. B2-4-8]|uniref:dipeptide ABC transporter ATP-binding protein n=1 Tax=Mesorhizobium sp. B2-4-8 TaxID=2589941 RepID=UPI00112C3973|nr:ABC transporter ATP-binding protein [Mesorhizobium sp. B2-4-8]TPL27435.1 ABC transporter ATP-binding protein [Mesorhizobium sp. B2-4-8]
MKNTTPHALDIRNLRVEYPLANGSILAAVDDIDLTIRPGEIHALVGESGAGKTTVGNALMGLLQAPGRIASGTITIAGKPIDIRTGRTKGIIPGRDVGAIFQDPMTSLNPLLTVESQLCEGMLAHLKIGRREARARALELMRAVGIPEPERRLGNYPHQLSGGQRQRVVIATALACDPRLIVADEPTTALDVSVQAQILKLIRELADDRRVGVLLVTHNMGVVAEIADRVTIMQNGCVVESGLTRDVLTAPKAPYARTLIAAVPPIDIRLDRLPVPSEETKTTLEAREAVRSKNTGTAAGRNGEAALTVRNLCVEYGQRSFIPGRKASVFKAVKDVSFEVRRGEIFGLVGESGCGKTTVANTIAGLVTQSSGTIEFQGTALAARRDKTVRQSLQMVFQDPYSALNPRLRINSAIAEPILFYKLASSAAEARLDAETLLEAVGLPAQAGSRFAHAFSGGQRQRIAIARALGPRPSLLICDEPTSALDVSVQAQILNLLKDLRDLAGLSMLFISHDLAVIRQMCDRVAVMKGGEIVELADTETLFSAPTHEYTRELLRLAPSLDRILCSEKREASL